MSEYIEDRISSLENRVSDIERHYNLLMVRVNDLEDRTEDHNDDILLLSENLERMGKEIERLRCEVRGTEYLDPLTNNTVDQSAEEFVKVVRCKDCKHSYDAIGGTFCSYGVCVDCIVDVDFFCKNGERRADDEVSDDR